MSDKYKYILFIAACIVEECGFCNIRNKNSFCTLLKRSFAGKYEITQKGSYLYARKEGGRRIE